MDFRKVFLITVILLIIGIGAVSAANETDSGNDVEILSAADDEVLSATDDDEVLGGTVEFNGTTFTDLRSQINSSSDGDEINLTSDIRQDGNSDIKIDKSITINGNGHTIDAKEKSGIFNVTADNVVLNNITFINGNAYNGGAIYWTGANGKISNSTFTNNTEAWYGGAIYWTGANGKISNSTFTQNNGYYGRAIYWTGANGKISNSTFTNNTVTWDGGAIYWTGENGKISNSTFTNNTAYYDGGAIYWTGENGKISNSTFTNNTATSDGGAICWKGTNGTLKQNNITNNKATENGGAIYWPSANGIISNSTFTNNTAYYDGGAIYWTGSQGTLKQNNITNNKATENGGAIYWTGTNGTLKQNNITNNNANNGGAIYWTGDNGTLTHNTLTHNTAKQNGGAIYWFGKYGLIIKPKFKSNTATEGPDIYNTTNLFVIENTDFTTLQKIINHYSENSIINLLFDFTFNTTTDTGEIKITTNGLTINGNGHTIDAKGKTRIFNITADNVILKNITFINGKTNIDGGAINSNGEANIISNCQFTNNTAIWYGGAIYRTGNDGKVTECKFTNNTGGYGGAINWDYGNYGQITQNTFTNNKATTGGAIHWWNSDNGEIINNTFTNNTATTYGGAIYWHNGTDGLIADSIFKGNTANEGPNIYNLTYVTIGDGNFAILQKIINHASQNSIINLLCDFTFNTATDTGEIKITTNGLTINGNGHTINAKGKTRIFNITADNVILKNITFINGNADNGGAIYWNGADGTITNSTFTKNTAEYGGAIYWTGNTGTLTQNNLTQNTAKQNGGAIYWTGMKGTLTQNTLTQNTADYGGAIHWSGTQGTLTQNNITHNTATTYGGAIFWNGDIGTLKQNNITNNKATQYGGAIYSTNKDYVTATNCNFQENTAVLGGAMYDGTAINSTFTQNHAVTNYDIPSRGYGGAIYNGYAKNCKFIRNSASVAGGTYNTHAYTCSFINNTAELSEAMRLGTAVFCYLENNDEYTGRNYTYINANNFTSTYKSGKKLLINLTYNNTQFNGYNVSIYVTAKYGFEKEYYALSGDGWIVDLPVGTYTAELYTPNYFPVMPKYLDITITKSPTTLSAENLTTTFKSDDCLVATLKDGSNNPIINTGVYVDLDGKTYKTDENGQINISTKNLAPGNYTVKITYAGDGNYNSSEITAGITINKADTRISADKLETVYNSDDYLTITLTDENDNNISGACLTVNEANYTTDENGQINISTKDLETGSYTLEVTYRGNENYSQSSKTLTDIIKVVPAEVTINDIIIDSIVYGNNNTVKVKGTVTSNVQCGANYTDNITVNISTFSKTVQVNADGSFEAIIELENILNAGNYNVIVSVAGNKNFKSSEKTFKNNLTVKKATVTIQSMEDITVIYSLNETLTVTGKLDTVQYGENYTGEIIVQINTLTNTTNAKNGEFTVIIKGAQYWDAGNYTITASGAETANYNSISEKTAKLTINRNQFEIDANITGVAQNDVKTDQNATVTIDTTNIPSYATGQIIINVTEIGKNYTIEVPVSSNTIQIDIIATPGTYTLNAQYTGNKNYNASETVTKTFEVSNWNETDLQELIDNSTGNVTLEHNYTFTNPNATVNINESVTINGNNHTIDANGSTTVLNITSDNVTVANMTVSNVNGTAIASNGTNTSISNIDLNNVNGTAIQMNTDNSTVSNVTATNTTGTLINVTGDNNNISNINSTGNATISVDGKNNQLDNVTGATVIPTIKATSTVKGGDVIITATVSATEGNVTVTFQGKNYTAELTNGEAKITLKNVEAGTYNNIPVAYEGSGLYQNVSTTTSFTSQVDITGNKDVTIDYLSGYKYTVRIKNADGTYASGVTVKMTVNGVTYNVKTDKNGYAKLLIKLKPKTYKITVQYLNVKKTNKITVKSTIFLVKKTVTVKKTAKKFVLKAKLKWSNGKAIKGKVIKFKFKGKVYKAKTNSKGIAKVTVKKSVIKKLKKGKTYKFWAKYTNEYKYGKVKVKK